VGTSSIAPNPFSKQKLTWHSSKALWPATRRRSRFPPSSSSCPWPRSWASLRSAAACPTQTSRGSSTRAPTSGSSRRSVPGRRWCLKFFYRLLVICFVMPLVSKSFLAISKWFVILPLVSNRFYLSQKSKMVRLCTLNTSFGLQTWPLAYETLKPVNAFLEG